MTALPDGFESFEFEIDGLMSRGIKGGRGAPLLLLHGSGPGASSLGNWRPVLEALAAHYEVTAVDLIGFGRSERRREPPYFDLDLWQRQTSATLERIDRPLVHILAHSIAAVLAFRLAAVDQRVARIVTTGAMGAHFPVTDALHRVWRCPRSRDAMRAAACVLIADASRIDDAYLDQRMAVIGAPGYADYFDEMFEGPLDRYITASVLDEPTLQAVRQPVLMVHGRDDLAFPCKELSTTLSRRLPTADLAVLSRCGHSVALERGDVLVALCHAHFQA